MRNAFADEITKLAAEDSRVMLLSGDIGNRLFDDYKAQFPDRFLNAGIAEGNMISVAAGMALSGLRPVVYTITPFLTTRCLEQIRVDLCYQNLPVTLIGVGGGLSYAELGATHHSCEDIGLMRMLPGMVVECPGDAVEVRLGLRAALRQDRPMYIRLGKRGEPIIHSEAPKFSIGTSISVRDGSDVCFLSTGNMLGVSIHAAGLLNEAGTSTRVESFHTVKPLDEELLRTVFDHYRLVVTIEEHSVLGGLGGSVAEWLADRPTSPIGRLMRVGTPDAFFHEAGEQEHARAQLGLTPDDIASRVLTRERNLNGTGNAV